MLGAAGFLWFTQTHGTVQPDAVVTTTSLPAELSGSEVAPTVPATSTAATAAAKAAAVSKAPATSQAPATPSTHKPASRTRPATPAPARPVTVTVTATSPRPAKATCLPTRITIPFGSSNHPNGVDIELIPHALNADSSLWVPGPDTDVANWTSKVGWSNENVRPGSGAGTVITIGHINYNGEHGSYSDLAEYLNSDIGQTFTVSCQSGQTIKYRISGGLLADKGELAADWRQPGQPLHHQLFDQQAVYGTAGQPSERFLLMSCGGVLDESAHSYESNIFVYGLRVS